MREIKIYSSDSYKEFKFCDDYKEVSAAVAQVENTVFIAGNYFVSPGEYLKAERCHALRGDNFYLLARNDYEKINNHLLLDQQLVAGKVCCLAKAKKENSLGADTKFKQQLLHAKLKWAQQFLRCIHEHLSTRESEGKMLVQHYNVKILISDVIAHIQMAEMLLEIAAYDTAVDEVLAAIKVLARLAGGRGFLRGNVISMLWLFTVLRNVYFTKAMA
jgi:hypothetical protein